MVTDTIGSQAMASLIDAAFLYADGDGCHFMGQDTFETLTLRPDMLGDDRLLLADNVLVQIQKFNGTPSARSFRV